MDVREKLVELLDDMQRSGTGYFGNAIENKKIADHLISNGVTVQEWISVKERQKAFLDKFPTVDAVEVVRCKDCKHRYSDSWCEYVDDDDNFYCARGERREGSDNG